MVSAPATTNRVYHGVVRSFDVDRGTGEVTGLDAAVYPFHCTAIADGSRQIALDTAVSFVLVFGRCGEVEGRSLTPL